MTKQDRLLYLINVLRSRRTMNAARLAAECGVTERSIYRDITSLSEANIPIYYDNGYKLASDNFLPALNLNFEEYTCLKVALESSPLAKTGHNAALLKQVTAKIEAGLSAATRERRKTARDTQHVEIATSVNERRAARFYGDIEKAINEQEQLVIEYDTVEHGLTHRVVEPYFIVFRVRAFYFVAYCRLRENFRTFRIDRIRNLHSNGERFSRKPGINARDYFDDSWRLFKGDPVEVRLRFTGRAAKVITSGSHHPREKVTPLDTGEVLYDVTVSGTEEIRRWILSFGEEVEVLEPASLRSELLRTAKSLCAAYGKSKSGK